MEENTTMGVGEATETMGAETSADSYWPEDIDDIISEANATVEDTDDDENDGVIGAFVTQTLYKGTYYQVQIYTDTDEDFYIDTTDEWDIGDRVGVKLDPAKIKAEPLAEEADNEENAIFATIDLDYVRQLRSQFCMDKLVG